MIISPLSKLFKKLSLSSMGNYKKVTHVIFDLDGLVLDSEVLYAQAMSTVIESFGKKYDDDLRLAVLGTKECDTAKIIVEKLDLPTTPSEFARLAKIEQNKVLGNAELKPGAEMLINHFSKNNIPMAIATSSGEESIKIKMAKFKSLMSKFQHVVSGTSDPEVVNGKPAPDIFLVAAKRFIERPAQPQDCLVFEDAPNGVKGARAADMQVVMVPEDYIPSDMKLEATLVIDSLCDFQPELFGLPPLTNE